VTDRVAKAEAGMRENPSKVSFADLEMVCRDYFGIPRQTGGSHMVFKMPWAGDPRVNIQNQGGRAKTYQVKQVLAAIDKLNTTKEGEASE
jgi:hypothetical protein